MQREQTIDDLIKKLKTYFARQDDVAVAYLFGSVARGHARSTSDVDIGIVFHTNDDPLRYGSIPDSGTADQQATIHLAESRLFRRVAFIDELEQLLSRPVDVVDLITASPAFNHHVFRHKVVLKGRRASARIAFETQVRRLYFDMLPYHKRYEEASLRRLKKGVSADGRRNVHSGPLEDARAIHKRLKERERHGL